MGFILNDYKTLAYKPLAYLRCPDSFLVLFSLLICVAIIFKSNKESFIKHLLGKSIKCCM